MGQLIASVVALFVGPALVWAFGKRTVALAFVDGLVMVALGGLITLHLLPESLHEGGLYAVGAAAVGLVAPPLIERRLANRPVHAAFQWAAIAGLTLHALLDGAAFAVSDAGGNQLLPFAVVLHRIPEGLAAWWLFGVQESPKRALPILLLVTASTVAGFVGAAPLLAALPASILAVFQALVAGLLFHVVFAHPPHFEGERAPRSRAASAFGAMLAVGMLVLVERFEAGHEHVAGTTMWTLALAAAPPLLVALVAAGVLHGLFPARSTELLRRGSTFVRAIRGVFHGLPLPVQACDAVPRYRGLIRAGASPVAAISFLVATPALGLDALLLGVPFLGAWLGLARLLMALTIALVIGVVVGAAAPAPTPSGHRDAPANAPLGARLRHGLEYGFGELFDHVAPWILAGLGAAAALDALLPAGVVARIPGVWQVPLMALAGLPVYVCASGAMPVALVLMARGLTPGAAMAFLLTAPAIHLTAFRVLSSLHGRRVAVAVVTGVAALAIGCGYAIDAWLGATPVLGPLAEGLPALLCLAAAGGLVAVSLWRQGPRGFLAQLITPHDREGHDHVPGHHCGHEHP